MLVDYCFLAIIDQIYYHQKIQNVNMLVKDINIITLIINLLNYFWVVTTNYA
jgi:hypothetical protein